MEQLHPLLQQNEYLIRRKLLFGRYIKINDSTGAEVLFIDRDNEQFMIFADDSKSSPLLKINIKGIKDTAWNYEVTDTGSNDSVGYFEQGLIKKNIKDQWLIFSASGEKIGIIKEAGWVSAIFGRLIGWIYPQKFVVETTGGEIVARITGTTNPVILKNKLKIESLNPFIDRRLLIAAGLLLTTNEGRQISIIATGGGD